ncbi:serpin family protein [Runella salmonicolor]|uniref:Serpin family protein n=1 Tax=Runella salmonicolor TaxID=2950278 RepID=A0ABT1FRC1_9BACT|nr:serpin family protein [Runella salmonicolor]MCP1384262.1 serpin family protein [Runella salmonicolor]
MRTSSFFQCVLVIAATLMLLWVALGCSSTSPSPVGEEVKISENFASRTDDFAFDFFKRLNEQEPSDKNVFVSPLSLHMALGMLLNGANGQTADEIQKTLKLNGISLADANATYLKLIEGLPKADPKVTLGLANSVWNRNTFQPETDFVNILKNSFKAEASQFSGSDATPLNTWASDKTNGKIKKVLDNIEPQMVLFLMNALYFKGDWTTSFDEQKTTDYPFQLAESKTKNVKMMQMKNKISFANRDGYFAYELPYGNGRYAMTVLVPIGTQGVNDLVTKLTATEWNQLQQGLKEVDNLSIGLPRFTLEYEVYLNKVLEKMGMPSAFLPNVADLSKISKTQKLNVGFVKQNTYVAVDEKGTEAAAVTTIGVELTSLPQTYYADRPFVFIISEKTSDTVLFMGKIVNPS